MKNVEIRERFVKLGRKRLDDIVLAHIMNEVEAITDLKDCIDILCLLRMEYSDELSYFEMNVLIYMIAEYDSVLTFDEKCTLFRLVDGKVIDMLNIVEYYDYCDEYDEYDRYDNYDDGRYTIYDVYSPSELGVHVTYR